MHTLENVIWQALSTRQAEFAQSSALARRFIPEVGPLAGFSEGSRAGYESLADLVPSHGTIALFLDEPFEERDGWAVIGGSPLLEMVFEPEIGLPESEQDLSQYSSAILSELGEKDVHEMLELAELTRPGPFCRRTSELGSFLGIRQAGQLVAMAGERMKVPGFTEVSAVCTRPGHTGHGYAARLTATVMRGILVRGETPFLHVRKDNLRAIDLYTRLSFKTRVELHFVVLRKTHG